MADCSLNGLSNAAKCFDCLDLTTKQAFKAFFLAQGLKALGGPDFTNVNSRRSSIACFNCEPDFRLDSMDVVVAQRLAINGGAGTLVTAPINILRQQIRCVPCGDTFASLQTDIMFLRCQLNKFIGSGAQ